MVLGAPHKPLSTACLLVCISLHRQAAERDCCLLLLPCRRRTWRQTISWPRCPPARGYRCAVYGLATQGCCACALCCIKAAAPACVHGGREETISNQALHPYALLTCSACGWWARRPLPSSSSRPSRMPLRRCNGCGAWCGCRACTTCWASGEQPAAAGLGLPQLDCTL